MNASVQALHLLLQRNDQRVHAAAESAVERRAQPARPSDVSNCIVQYHSHGGPISPAYAGLHDALEAAQGAHHNGIVCIERSWFVDQNSSRETQRQQFQRALDALRTGKVSTSSAGVVACR